MRASSREISASRTLCSCCAIAFAVAPAAQLVVARLCAGEAGARALERGARLLDLALVGRGAQLLEAGDRRGVIRPRRLDRLLSLVQRSSSAGFRPQILEAGDGRGVVRPRRLQRLLSLEAVLITGFRRQVSEAGDGRGRWFARAASSDC